IRRIEQGCQRLRGHGVTKLRFQLSGRFGLTREYLHQLPHVDALRRNIALDRPRSAPNDCGMASCGTAVEQGFEILDSDMVACGKRLHRQVREFDLWSERRNPSLCSVKRDVD